MGTWEITGRQVRVLWHHVYPRIVALSWQNPDYREAFGAGGDEGLTFRINELQRVADVIQTESDQPLWSGEFIYPERMGVWVRKNNGRTNFFLTPRGMILPWPDVPDRNRLVEAYALIGGTLPRTNDAVSKNGLFKTISAKAHWERSKIQHSPLPPEYDGVVREFKKVADESFENDTYFYGNDFLSLMQQLSLIVARAWDDPRKFGQEYRANPRCKISDISLPSGEILGEELDVEADTEADDVKIEVVITNENKASWKLVVPSPPKPKNRRAIFRELIEGHASNPLYTGCPGDCGPG